VRSHARSQTRARSAPRRERLRSAIAIRSRPFLDEKPRFDSGERARSRRKSPCYSWLH